ncbi:MAG: hypothetical protein GC154_14520 [bacterium]|nr:hypothetical protein [bacterium]
MDLTLPSSADAVAGGQYDAQTEKLRMMALGSKGKMSEKKMRETADQFEQMIVRQLLKEMRKTVPKEDGLFGEDSHAMEMYTDMSDDALAENIATNSSLGLDQTIYEELKRKNDTLADPKDVSKEDHSDFKSLNGKYGFMNLEAKTEDFMPLHDEPKMFDLKRKGGDFKSLSKATPISTDQIENR